MSKLGVKVAISVLPLRYRVWLYLKDLQCCKGWVLKGLGPLVGEGVLQRIWIVDCCFEGKKSMVGLRLCALLGFFLTVSNIPRAV